MNISGKLPKNEWLEDTDIKRLMSALMATGKLARFVGGCVRDTLLSREFSDIDIATEAPPEQVMHLLKQAKIAAKPLGIEHGSVMAILNKRSYNITTLRTDEETDGRYARVSFTDDWTADANRRDFTINALYADLDGSYYDPCQGYQDLKEGIIRFIGDENQRICEDYLRILRYFRFQAHYGRHPSLETTLAACKKHAANLQSISKERIWTELQKLLEAEDITIVLNEMKNCNILDQIFSNEIDLSGISQLIENERTHQIKASALRRLTAISLNNVQKLGEDLKLAKRELAYISRLHKLAIERPDLNDTLTCNSILYNDGPDLFLDLNLLMQHNMRENFFLYKNWSHPKLPISGQDLIDNGLSEGPEVGKNLKAVTQWWIEQAFKPNAKECLDWSARNKL